MTTFGDQVYQFGGMPIQNSPQPYSMYRNAIFVDMDNGADGHDGKGLDRAKVTIQAGIDAAYAGDMIVVLGGRHILPSTGLVTPLYKSSGVDRGQITFIGGGNAFGDAVTLSSSANTSYPSLNVRSPGWRISGFRFVYAGGGARTGSYGGSLSAAVHLTQANLTGTTNTAQSYYTTIDNNYFFYCGSGITSSGATYTATIRNNMFEVCSGSGIYINNTGLARPRSWRILDNYFCASVEAGTSGTHIDAGGRGWNNSLFARNYLDNSALVKLNNKGGLRCLVTQNYFGGTYTTDAYQAGSSDMWAGNHVATTGSSGTLETACGYGVSIQVPST